MLSNLTPISEAKAKFNVSGATIERWINKNYIKVKIAGDVVFICTDSLDEFKRKGKDIGYQVI